MSDQPDIKPPEPVVMPIFLILTWLGTAVLANFWVPTTIPLPGAGLAGAGLFLVAFWLIIWTFWVFNHAKTTVNPHGNASSLVTDGPFRFSRNPIYLAMLVGGFGIGLAVPNLWIVLGTAPVFVVLDRGVIADEERFLREKFGAEYNAYCTNVRRWI